MAELLTPGPDASSARLTSTTGLPRVLDRIRKLFRSPSVSSLCEVVNPDRYNDRHWLTLHHDLSRYGIDPQCFRNHSGEVVRKGWEMTQCIYGLEKLGMIRSESTALGVGAGREGVIWWLADHIGHVTATDLYVASSSASPWQEADLGRLEEAKRSCPPSVDHAKVTFENQDGTRLTYPDNSFDFAWSLSSIEHFGGHEAAAQSMREMARVVRPGGIVAVATEILLLEEYQHPEFFTRANLDKYLIRGSRDLALVSPVNHDALPREYLIDSVVFPGETGRLRRHVVLNNGYIQWTSVMLFLRKKMG
jgi:SAM-dependent methyltransferase